MNETSTSLERVAIIADLGEINAGRDRVTRRLGLPGMKILHPVSADNKFLPHTMPLPIVWFIPAPDNDTARGWFETALAMRRFACRYLR
jgi:4-alpha-glucanotransferase